jgi:hypothetical protein
LQHNKDSLLKNLRPYYPSIYQAIEEGFTGAFNVSVERDLSNPRTIANVRWELITNKLEKLLPEDEFLVIREYGTCIFCHKTSNIVFRLKKFDLNYRSSNIPTQRNFDFENNQLTIEGIDLPICLEIGYIPDNIGNGVESVSIQCRKYNWMEEIEPTITKIIGVIEPEKTKRKPEKVRVSKKDEKSTLKIESGVNE